MDIESLQKIGLNKSGSICGTPPYMSPEQRRGEKEIDIRAHKFYKRLGYQTTGYRFVKFFE
jgi:serine/threonine protein kinase